MYATCRLCVRGSALGWPGTGACRAPCVSVKNEARPCVFVCLCGWVVWLWLCVGGWVFALDPHVPGAPIPSTRAPLQHSSPYSCPEPNPISPRFGFGHN